MNNTKICTKCGRELSIECFGKDSKSKDGLAYCCKECNRQRSKEYRQTHKEKIKQYNETHREERLQCVRNYRKTEKYKKREKERRQSKEYKERRKISDKIYSHNRRAKEKQGKGLQNYEIAQEILNEWFDNSCAYSGKELTNDTINWDHIIPLKKDGVNEIWNLIPSYCIYNNQKNAREPYKWYKEQEYYDEDRLNYIIYYQKVMYWNFANKDSEALVLITGEIITYEEIEEEYGVLEGATC